MKQKKNNVRWLVACRLPKEKVHNMRAMGFKRNEIFGFPTKRAAFGFIKEIKGFGVECAFARS